MHSCPKTQRTQEVRTIDKNDTSSATEIALESTKYITVSYIRSVGEV